ncbi:hypothetical protein BIW11_12600 [Tropilaelaps mercedesae]|uniref:Uncharacterized protein n=1 Tax=Tropilaelaps mercedesae TaxID=418985 RepID=A0A1V9X5P4_9ACAR|nr:hypothetical protein BIW11_12600 [Tropilaelaps mercedesae]
MTSLCRKVVLVVAFLVVPDCIIGQDLLSAEQIREYIRYANEVPSPRSTRIVKRQAPQGTSAPIPDANSGGAIGTAAGTMMAGMSRVAAHVPQYFVEGRHYWPTQFSLTRQFGLQGINQLIGEVVEYERSRALAAARDSSCRQRDSCLWNQRFVVVTNLFGTLNEEQRLMQKIDCNAVFAGCENYH